MSIPLNMQELCTSSLLSWFTQYESSSLLCLSPGLPNKNSFMVDLREEGSKKEKVSRPFSGIHGIIFQVNISEVWGWGKLEII